MTYLHVIIFILCGTAGYLIGCAAENRRLFKLWSELVNQLDQAILGDQHKKR